MYLTLIRSWFIYVKSTFIVDGKIFMVEDL